MLDMENYRTGRPMAQLTPWSKGPFTVLKAAPYTVTLWLPTNITIFPTFYIFHIRCIHHKGIEGQDQAEDNISTNHGKLVTHTDDGEDMVEWRFEYILDFGKVKNERWQYLGEWTGHDQPTW
jgi:hypothetical protein